MKALVGAFNQEKALVGAFSVIVRPVVEPMDRFTALVRYRLLQTPGSTGSTPCCCCWRWLSVTILDMSLNELFLLLGFFRWHLCPFYGWCPRHSVCQGSRLAQPPSATTSRYLQASAFHHFMVSCPFKRCHSFKSTAKCFWPLYYIIYTGVRWQSAAAAAAPIHWQYSCGEVWWWRHYIGGNIMRCTAARKLLTNIFVGFKTMPLKHLTMFHEPLKLSS